MRIARETPTGTIHLYVIRADTLRWRESDGEIYEPAQASRRWGIVDSEGNWLAFPGNEHPALWDKRSIAIAIAHEITLDGIGKIRPVFIRRSVQS